MTDIRADETHADLDEEDRLPWLEAVDEDEGGDGPSALKLIAAVLIGLVAIGAIVGGIFWMGNRDGQATGDAQLIAAPEGDYKVSPDDPGGMKVEGEGDTAFAASEGAEPKGAIDTSAVPEAPVDHGRRPRAAQGRASPGAEAGHASAQAGRARSGCAGERPGDPARRLLEPGRRQRCLEDAVGPLLLSRAAHPHGHAGDGRRQDASIGCARPGRAPAEHLRPPARGRRDSASADRLNAGDAAGDLRPGGRTAERGRARFLPRRRPRRLHLVQAQLRRSRAASRADRRSARHARPRRSADPDRPGRRPGRAHAAAGLARNSRKPSGSPRSTGPRR